MFVALSRVRVITGWLDQNIPNTPRAFAGPQKPRVFPVFPRLVLAADGALRILTIWVSAAPRAFPVHPRQAADGQGGPIKSHGKLLLESLLTAMLV